jgi:DNA-binding winged helix-turn-helix (wHTH) protein/predicted ATPase
MAVIYFGSYRLHPVQGLALGDREVRITAKSLAVLRLLASRANDVVTKEEIFGTVWADTAVSDAALTSCIQELRHALGDDARRPRFIETLHRRGYRFLPPVSAVPPDSPAGAAAAADTAIVGRDEVIAELVASFDLAATGLRQVRLISGDAGIGKTTVVRAVLGRVGDAADRRVTWGQCVEHHGVGEPYQPLLEALTRLCRQPGGHETVAALEQYAPTWLAQIPELVPTDRREPARRSAAGATPARMQRELTGALEALASRRPLLLCLEDLHWCDASTLDWIGSFARRTDPARILLLATFRASDISGTGQLAALAGELAVKGLCREVVLAGLDEAAVAEYLHRRFPPSAASSPTWPALSRLVHRHTEGNALFVTNVLGDLAARQLLVAGAGAGAWDLTRDLGTIELGVPDDLRRMIERRLDRLDPAERAVLDAASACGQLFAAASAAAGAEIGTDAAESVLAHLARHHRFVRAAPAVGWPDGTISSGFEFLHALYRTVVYDRLPAGRRAELHRRIGVRLEGAFQERARNIASELARHFEQGRDADRAVVYLQHAAEHARRRSAYPEARLHYERALALLPSRAAGDRLEREIALRTGLGGVIMATEGWGSASAASAYSRARSLSHEVGDASQLFPALWGLWLYYWGRGPLATAAELAEELLALAERAGDPARVLQAHHAMWATDFSCGRLERAIQHARAGLALYDESRDAILAATFGNHDAGVCARLFLARAIALHGQAASALRAVEEAVARARALDHPFTLALARVFAAGVTQALRDPNGTREHAAAAVAIARDQDFRLLLAWATAFEGWAAHGTGHEDGIGLLTQALGQARDSGSDQFLTLLLGLLADACLAAGRNEVAATAIGDALAVVDRTGERFNESELYRLRGHVALAAGAVDRAAADYRRAMDVASAQRAHLPALRAAVALARLAADAERRGDVERLVHGARAALGELPPPADAADLAAVLERGAGRGSG